MLLKNSSQALKPNMAHIWNITFNSLYQIPYDAYALKKYHTHVSLYLCWGMVLGVNVLDVAAGVNFNVQLGWECEHHPWGRSSWSPTSFKIDTNAATTTIIIISTVMLQYMERCHFMLIASLLLWCALYFNQGLTFQTLAYKVLDFLFLELFGVMSFSLKIRCDQ